MRLIFTSLFVFVLISFSPALGKADSCLESFRNFDPVEAKTHSNPTDQFENYNSVISMAWYGVCILVGSAKGLLLYDINHTNAPIVLAHVNARAISNIAVNPQNMTIVFNVDQEPTVYFIKSDETVSTWEAQGEAITRISFSSDGSLMAVASTKIMGHDTELWGLYYDSAIQILNTLHVVTANIPSSSDRTYVVVTKSIFSVDNQYLLTHDVREGYDGDNVTYWDLQSGQKVWDYGDLFNNLGEWIPNIDPLYITNASMSNRIAALGGRAGVNNWDDYNGIAVRLWDVNTRQHLGYVVVSQEGSGHDEDLLTDLILNHDGSILVTGQTNGLVRFWNTKAASERPKNIQLSTSISQLEYDSSEAYLAVRSGTRIVIWDANENKKVVAFSLVKDS